MWINIWPVIIENMMRYSIMSPGTASTALVVVLRILSLYWVQHYAHYNCKLDNK